MTVATPPPDARRAAGPKASKYLKGIQALRGLALLVVVATHAAQAEARSADGAALDLAFNYAGAQAVDLFFVISGFIIVWVSGEDPKGARAAALFGVGRAARVYPLHWAVAVPLTLLLFVRPETFQSMGTSGIDPWRSLFLLPDRTTPINPVAWTLVYEVYFYAVFAAAIWLLPARARLPAMLAWGGAVAALSFWGKGQGPVVRVYTDPLILEFVAGAVAGVAARRLDARSARLALAAGAALFAAAFVWRAGFDAPGSPYPGRWERVLLCLPGAFLVVLGAAAVELKTGAARFVPTWAEKLGDASYSIYLAHLALIVAAERVWAPIEGPGLLGNAVAIAVFIGVGVAGGLALNRIAERPFNAMAKALRSGLKARWAG